jgi:hypothetical protein
MELTVDSVCFCGGLASGIGLTAAQQFFNKKSQTTTVAGIKKSTMGKLDIEPFSGRFGEIQRFYVEG